MSILGLAAAPTLFAPIVDTLAAIRARHGAGPVRGLVPGLIAPDTDDFWSAAELFAPPRLDELLAAAAHRWNASPHAAAALAWKAYTYWLLVPAVYGYASARRIPLLDAANVGVHVDRNVAVGVHVDRNVAVGVHVDRNAAPLLTIGVREAVVTVLANDPIAAVSVPNIRTVADETALLAEFRRTVYDAHLAPLLAALNQRLRLGRRTLLGSVASGIAHALNRASDLLPGSVADTAEALLRALSVENLVELTPDGVQRKTCCLAFTLPAPKICRGCCIR